MLFYIRRIESIHNECAAPLAKKFSLSVLHRMRLVYLSIRQRMTPSSNGAQKGQMVPQMSTSSFDFIIENNNSKTVYGKNGEMLTMKEIDVNDQRDELEDISHSLTGLTSLLSEMSEKVLAQGEMVDRIDVNTKVALELTKKGNEVLKDCKDILENGCAARLQKMLMLFNLILFVLIIIKFKYF